MEDKLYWLALNMVPGVGPIAYRNLVAKFQNPQGVFAASVRELSAVEGIGEKTIKAINDFPVEEVAAEELKKAEGLGVSILTFRDQGYPRDLLQIYDFPPLLYMRGELGEEDSLAVAIVGSRRGSPYGRAVTKRISKELSSAGVTVVSGMARGIDTFAHLGALEAGGRTIAVLGCGVDIIYPPENKRLFFDIIDHGAVISEFPLSTPPEGKNFPKRNRIISGLSLGVVIVEATADSGSLITASHALEQGREVFAVPGNVGMTTSQGTNRLIKQGAKLVEGAGDILTEIFPQYRGKARHEELPVLNDEEQVILQLLSHTPLHIDEISRQGQMEVQRVSTILLELELKGLISQLGGKMFVRN
ncbi:MAG: DNA-protecting protein DprA [Deltaproteobacteria bacterium]|nr:DNA-protecting protein DprA [Deltaproteobacteria bacterium]